MKNVNDLRDILFGVLSDLREGKIETEKAREIGSLSQVIINSAKAEVDMAKVTGASIASGFFEGDKTEATGIPEKHVGLPSFKVKGVTTHRMVG